MTYFRKLGSLAAVAALLVGCSETTGPNGDASVQILLTDEPSDYIESAEVTISRIYLQGGADDEDDEIDGEESAAAGVDEEDGQGGRVDLFNDPENPLVFDLLLLRDGVTADLTGEVDIEARDYHQLRLVVVSAVVTLVDGYTFNDGSTEMALTIPSGAQSGIKVQLAEPIEADEGSNTIILVDFNVDDNFVIQGNPETPAGINGILFTPVLREVDRDIETDES